MKFKRDKNYDDFDTDYNVNYNSKKKVRQQEDTWTKDDYEHYSNILILTPVNHKDIDGYVIEVDGEIQYCKYDMNSQLFVNYRITDNKVEIIKSYKRSYRDYQGNKYIEYIDEISNDE